MQYFWLKRLSGVTVPFHNLIPARMLGGIERGISRFDQIARVAYLCRIFQISGDTDRCRDTNGAAAIKLIRDFRDGIF